MNWQVVKELVAYGREQEKLHNKKFRFTLTTNGVLLNDEVMEFCNREMGNVVLSVDGRKEVHDFMRPFRKGAGSYDLIIPKFQKFAESRNQDKYYVRGTFTHHNLDFSKDVLHLADLGFKQISVEPVVAPETEDYAIREEDIPQIMEEYAQDISCSGASVRNRKRTKLVSFYSPDRADAQTATALAAGQMLSNAGSKTLYLNLRAFAGFEELLHTEFEADVTDYFYFVLQYADKALYKLESMRKTLGELHYLPPALDYADLLQITEQQWEQAIDVLLDSGHYEVILLDLSEICQGFYSLLARSDKIVFLQGDSRQSQAMKMQYQKLLEARGAVKITDKTCYSTLPENWEKECCNYERLAATRMGELMKRELWDIRDRGAVNGEI